jgi:serine/threonine-protein kinase
MPLVGDSLVAIEARGEWLAIAPATPTPEHRDLGIWSLKQGIPQQTGRIRRTSPCFQILALDSRHLGVFSHLQEDSSPPSQGFQLELFTRHAQKLGAWQLPLALQQIFPTPIPYRLLTTEPDHPTSLLIIDLKPLRIQRIGLDLVPQWITTTAWGYVLMDTNGQIELLSPYGQVLGRIEGPTAPTAIATLDPYTLAISTWHQTSGSLHLIDLRTLDLDIIF